MEKRQTQLNIDKRLFHIGTAVLAVLLFAAIVAFWVFYPDNLMHSDMAAEVILAKLLNKEGALVTPNWYYSTELRVVYSQLVMMPLFWLTSDFGVVKLVSIIVLNVLCCVSYYFVAKEFDIKKGAMWLSLALLLAPLSTEYLDMMFLGNFYTAQTICTYLFLLFYFRVHTVGKVGERVTEGGERSGESDGKPMAADSKKQIVTLVLLCIGAFIVGLSGVRYLANMFLPLLAAVCWAYLFDRNDSFGVVKTDKGSEEGKNGRGMAWLGSGVRYAFPAIALTFFCGVGWMLNAKVLPKYYSFADMGEVGFVRADEILERLKGALTMILEFVGFRFTGVTPRFACVNALRIAFIACSVIVLFVLTVHRKELLNVKERILLYFFHFGFILNFLMEVFLTKDQEYRYYIPNYIVLVLLYGIFIRECVKKATWPKLFVVAVFALTAASTLYSELWQDTKYNDCEKRYGYMAFLTEQGYDYGYATFWNGPVTEYLANGEIHVVSVGGEAHETEPYRWLVPKAYLKPGFHEGKTFILLARTEEVALTEGVISIMQDSEKVYEDEYYVIYEGSGMYLYD
ncbi:MAG: hypothetical protein K6G07_08405 [Lachnospiraceae bacterium]|nr:hypothetical protein [Lachnospiraceae bacterium]